MPRARRVVVLAGAICVCASFLSAPATAAERYPVWWAPEFGIESLEEIDALLAKPFPEELRNRLYKFDYGRNDWQTPVDEQPIDDCLSLFEWLAAGYEWGLPRDNLLAYRLAYPYCSTLLALKRARPAQASYVRDFVMNLDTLDYMPSLVGYWTCRELLSHLQANLEGLSWNRFDFGYHSGWGYRMAVVENRNTFVLQTWAEDHSRGYDEVFEIIARGDFNGDGLDDLVLRMTFVSHRSGSKRPELFLLTRLDADDVLRVAEVISPLDSERNRCVPRPDELWKRP